MLGVETNLSLNQNRDAHPTYLLAQDIIANQPNIMVNQRVNPSLGGMICNISMDLTGSNPLEGLNSPWFPLEKPFEDSPKAQLPNSHPRALQKPKAKEISTIMMPMAMRCASISLPKLWQAIVGSWFEIFEHRNPKIGFHWFHLFVQRSFPFHDGFLNGFSWKLWSFDGMNSAVAPDLLVWQKDLLHIPQGWEIEDVNILRTLALAEGWGRYGEVKIPVKPLKILNGNSWKILNDID